MFAGNTSLGNLPAQGNNGAEIFANNNQPNQTGIFATNNMNSQQQQNVGGLFQQQPNTGLANNQVILPQNSAFLGAQQPNSFMQPNNQAVAFGGNQQANNGINAFNTQAQQPQNAFGFQQPQPPQVQQTNIGGLFTNQQPNNNSNGLFGGAQQQAKNTTNSMFGGVQQNNTGVMGGNTQQTNALFAQQQMNNQQPQNNGIFAQNTQQQPQQQATNGAGIFAGLSQTNGAGVFGTASSNANNAFLGNQSKPNAFMQAKTTGSVNNPFGLPQAASPASSVFNSFASNNQQSLQQTQQLQKQPLNNMFGTGTTGTTGITGTLSNGVNPFGTNPNNNLSGTAWGVPTNPTFSNQAPVNNGVQSFQPVKCKNSKLDSKHLIKCIVALDQFNGMTKQELKINFIQSGGQQPVLNQQPQQTMGMNSNSPYKPTQNRVIANGLQNNAFAPKQPLGQQTFLSNQTNTTANNIFGQQSQPTQPNQQLYGTNLQQQPLNLFSQQQQPQPTSFLGQQQQQPQQLSTNVFGQQQQQTSLFGQQQPQQQNPLFSQPQQQQQPQNSLFSQPQQQSQQQNPLFSQPQQQNPLFSQPQQQQTSLFAQQQQQQTPSTSIFGQQQQPQTQMFGQQQQTQPNTSLFGINQPQASTILGQTQQPASNSLFGNQTAQTSPLFSQAGQSLNTNPQPSPLFTQQPATTTLFGTQQNQLISQQPNTSQGQFNNNIGQFGYTNAVQPVFYQQQSIFSQPVPYQTANPAMMQQLYSMAINQLPSNLFGNSQGLNLLNKLNQLSSQTFQTASNSIERPYGQLTIESEQQVRQNYQQSNINPYQMQILDRRQIYSEVQSSYDKSFYPQQNIIIKEENINKYTYQRELFQVSQDTIVNVSYNYKMLKKEGKEKIKEVQSLLPNVGDFEIQPSYQTLKMYTADQLDRVRHFRIWNQFGEVQFCEPISLIGRKFDQIFSISQDNIEINDKDLQNKTVRMTFRNFGNYLILREDELKGFLKKMRKWISKNEMRQVRHDIHNGDLIVEVEH